MLLETVILYLNIDFQKYKKGIKENDNEPLHCQNKLKTVTF